MGCFQCNDNFYQPQLCLLSRFMILIPHIITLLLGSHSSYTKVWLSISPMCPRNTLCLPHCSSQQSICLHICLDAHKQTVNSLRTGRLCLTHFCISRIQGSVCHQIYSRQSQCGPHQHHYPVPSNCSAPRLRLIIIS